MTLNNDSLRYLRRSIALIIILLPVISISATVVGSSGGSFCVNELGIQQWGLNSYF